MPETTRRSTRTASTRGRADTERPASTGRSSRSSRGGSSFLTGQAGRDRIEVEQEKARVRKERRMKDVGKPFRFYVPVGETKEAVILDDEPTFFLYEHTMKNPDTGKWGFNATCIGEHDTCPLCENVGPSSYVMMLSVLDLSPYKDRAGVTHDFSRKLMAVKTSQQKKFVRHLEREGTLRGAIFEFCRDGEKDPVIGNDINFVDWMDEEELSNDYLRTWTDKEKKKHEENCGEAYVYEDLFEEPTYDDLAELAGTQQKGGKKVEHPAGSRRANRAAIRDEDENEGADGWEKDDKNPPWEEGDEPRARTRRGATREEEAPAPRGRRSARAPEPEPERASSRRASRRSEPEPEPEPETRSSRPTRRTTRR